MREKRVMRPGALSSDGHQEPFDWRKALEEKGPVAVSAPCRVDYGGTLDLRTFSYPLQPQGPCTVNLALNLRTTVRLEPYARGRVKVSSRGFRPAEFALGAAPFRHPLGLMFAVAAFFGAGGVHIRIKSESPPRSALGGSSVAAVALVRAFFEAARRGAPVDRRAVALTAHAIEESVAGVPCGYQDQLAAVFGGANLWHWVALPRRDVYRREIVVPPARLAELAPHLLVAYAGVTHASSDVNGRWVRQFVAGRTRQPWEDIVRWTHRFVDALKRRDYGAAADSMNRETAVRRRLTPDVLDDIGRRLVGRRRGGCAADSPAPAVARCGLREADAIERLRPRWQAILGPTARARLLDARVAREGLRIEMTA